MDLELRAVTESEFEEFIRVDRVAFSEGPPGADHFADLRKAVEFDRTRAVFEGGRMVAASAILSLDLTLPGLTIVPAAAVTWVGVLPTHRRRGHLTRMMAALLDDAAGRGESLAMLLASESNIYGRFGYGLASSHSSIEIENRYGAFRPSAPAGGGRIELLEAEHAAKVLPAVLDAARRRQPGDVQRPDGWWNDQFRDLEKQRAGAGTQFYAVHESASGEADGYAIYRVKLDWATGHPNGRVRVGEVVGLTPAAEADLWRYLLAIDLTDVVECERRPAEDPLRWLLVEPRRLHVTVLSDFLWVRPLDVAAALAARRYPVAGTLVLDVADDFRPRTAGRFRLEGGPDGAECRRTSAEPDFSLTVENLGAVYLGGVAPSALAAAGRIVEHHPGALARADAMLASHPAPFSRTGF